MIEHVTKAEFILAYLIWAEENGHAEYISDAAFYWHKYQDGADYSHFSNFFEKARKYNLEKGTL